MLLASIIVGLGFVAGCSHDDNPSGPSATNNANAPRIVSLSPASPAMSGTTQTITVTGERFASGLTVLLDAPNGVWTTYPASAITVQSATTFTARVMLDRVGIWDITVHGPDGAESNEMQFSVIATASQ